MRKTLLFLVLLLLAGLAGAQSYLDKETTQPFNDMPTPDNPIIARFDGGHVTLRNIEDYAAEIMKLQRTPRLVDGALWREHISKELVKEILFTSEALEMGLLEDPDLLRSRAYRIQEWMSYAILRDNVVNKIDVNVNRLRKFYEANKNDYRITATATLRFIRTKDKTKAEQAAKRLATGEPFDKVEDDVSEVSGLQRRRIFGPYPSTTTQSMIPPPKEVVEAAVTMQPGQTTGPLFVNRNFFIVQTVQTTPEISPKFEDVVEFVETRVREKEGDELTSKLISLLMDELGVQYDDEAAEDPNTRPEDIIATVGKTLVPLDEYTGLAKKVRGPAIKSAHLMKTRLGQFILPIMCKEAGYLRGYANHQEFLKWLFFRDIRQFGQRALDRKVDVSTPRVLEEEIRKYYEANANEKDQRGVPIREIPIEHMRDSIRELLNQQRRGDTEKQLIAKALVDAHFQMLPTPECTRLTAFEAFIAAASEIPKGYRVRMISSYPDFIDDPDQKETPSPSAMTDCGRRDKWRIVISNDADSSDVRDIIWAKPAKMFEYKPEFTSASVFVPWYGLWRFDTDSLARQAYDNGMYDYLAKHNWNVHINTRIEFNWEGPRARDCWVVFEMRPLAPGSTEVLTMRFSAGSGSMSRKPLHECLPCEQMKRLMNEPI